MSLVDNVNNGWTVAKALLGHERAMIGESIGRQPGSAQREVVGWARKHLRALEGPIPDPVIRNRMAALGSGGLTWFRLSALFHALAFGAGLGLRISGCLAFRFRNSRCGGATEP